MVREFKDHPSPSWALWQVICSMLGLACSVTSPWPGVELLRVLGFNFIFCASFWGKGGVPLGVPRISLGKHKGKSQANHRFLLRHARKISGNQPLASLQKNRENLKENHKENHRFLIENIEKH